MKDRYLLLIALLIIIFETTLLQIFRIVGIVPNIMLIWIVIASVLFDRWTSVKAAILAGVLQDLLIGKGLAINLSIYLVVAIFISMLEEKIFKDNYVTPVVLITSATVFYHLFMTVIHYFSTGDFVLGSMIIGILIPEIIYNLAVGVITYVRAFRIHMGYQMR